MSDANRLDRRGFLTRGFARALGQAADRLLDEIAPTRHIRPPGALPEPAFLAACTRCQECVPVCPVNAIRTLDADHGVARGTPVLDVAHTACVMCEDMPCAAACPTDALTRPANGWGDHAGGGGLTMASIVVDRARCLPYREVACGVCARVCPIGERAITLDGIGGPVFGTECTGCGICVTACVTNPSSLAATPP